jgi:hypothetical protein
MSQFSNEGPSYNAKVSHSRPLLHHVGSSSNPNVLSPYSEQDYLPRYY